MKAKCIDDKRCGCCLTLGKIYDIEYSNGPKVKSHYLVLDDKNEKFNYFQSRFRLLPNWNNNNVKII